MFRLSVALVALVVLVTPTSFLRAQQPESDAVADPTHALPSPVCASSDAELCVRGEPGSEPLVLQLFRAGARLDLSAPSAFSSAAVVEVSGLHDVMPLQGGVRAWRIALTEADRSFEWLAQERAGEFHLLWYSAGGENREQLRAEDLDADGDAEILVAVPVGTAGRCGDAPQWLAPRVYDSQRETFRPVSLRVAAADAEPLTAAPAALSDQFRDDATPVFVSSDASQGLTQSWGPPPAALTDGNPATYWTEAAAGSGEGQFVTFRTLPQIGVYGLQVDVGTVPGVRSLLVRLPDGRSYVTPELPSGQSDWVFPTSWSGSCVQVVVLEVADEAEHAALAELSLLTELDRRPVAAALDLYVLPALLRSTTPMERGILQGVVTSAQDAARPGLLQAIEETEGDEQALLLDTLLQLNEGPDSVLALFDTLEVDTAGYRRVAAGWPADRALPDDWFARLARATPSQQSGWLMLMTRVQAQIPVDQLFTALNLSFEATRLAFSEYLAAVELPSRLLASDAAAGPDPEWQRMLYRAAWRHVRQGDAPLDATALQIVRTMASTSTDGAVARYAVALLGESGDVSDVLLLQSMLRDDPEPVMRRQAAEALAALGRRDIGDAATVFESALGHEDPGVRLHAASLAARQVGLPVTRATLRSRLVTETWPETRRQVAAASLARAQTNDDVAAVLAALATWSASTVSAVLRQLPTAAGMVRCQDVTPVALAHADSEPVLVAAAIAMGHCDGDTATAWLRAHWNGGQASARLSQTALESAVLRGDEDAIQRGLALLGSTDPAERRNGALALHRSDRDVSDALHEALQQESDRSVTRALRTALGLSASDDSTSVPEW
jgi:hypothetical protein